MDAASSTQLAADEGRPVAAPSDQASKGMTCAITPLIADLARRLRIDWLNARVAVRGGRRRIAGTSGIACDTREIDTALLA